MPFRDDGGLRLGAHARGAEQVPCGRRVDAVRVAEGIDLDVPRIHRARELDGPVDAEARKPRIVLAHAIGDAGGRQSRRIDHGVGERHAVIGPRQVVAHDEDAHAVPEVPGEPRVMIRAPRRDVAGVGAERLIACAVLPHDVESEAVDETP